MFQSRAARLLLIAALIILMVVPLTFVGQIISSRERYQESAFDRIAQEWGGAQFLSGPILRANLWQWVETTETYSDAEFTAKPELMDADERGETPRATRIETPRTTLVEGEERTRITVTHEVKRWKKEAKYFHVLPYDYQLEVNSATDMRHVGIFDVPTYQAQIAIDFNFDEAAILEEAANQFNKRLSLSGKEWGLDYSNAELTFSLSENRVLRGDAKLSANGEDVAIEPLRSGRSDNITQGVSARVTSIADTKFHFQFSMNGSKGFQVTPVGRHSNVVIKGDWPHPRFGGEFLPDDYEISDAGFTANYSIPHIARNLQQISGDSNLYLAESGMRFGVDFIQPNDFYQKSARAAKYAILFVGLIFLSVFLLEHKAGRKISAVHYLMIGLAQSVFFLLLVSYAEQIGFLYSYLLSSVAVIGLLTLFALFALRLGKSAFLLFAEMLFVYVALYFIIQSADYALLLGSTLLFFVIAAVMFVTRDEEWAIRLPKREPNTKRPAEGASPVEDMAHEVDAQADAGDAR